jgi:ferredoxin--NADP+ reductase
MGQVIEVSSTPIGSVLLVDTDRSLTGQDGVSFDHSPEDTPDPPSVLATRLFDAIEGVESIHVLSNTLSVRRTTAWEPDQIAAAEDIVSSLFVFYAPESEEDQYEQLRDQYYNATLTDIRAHNDELWIIKVKPDEPPQPFDAGQYTSLALGFWEPRADGAVDDLREGQGKKLARRSYSVSSSIVDENDNLVEAHPDEVEFYIVKVQPDEEEIPALTPRLFRKDVGDRLFLGRKYTGQYTLEGVKPTDNVVFLGTGTGEAPHNAMTAELLRRGHEGKILSAVTVRFRNDLGYLREHEVVKHKWPNYNYVILTTREPENEGNKVYIQDLVSSGAVEDELGAALSPENTHVFLCGNPAMIGLPRWNEEIPEFPETLGVCELLHERGFTIDHRAEHGNVHYEVYWKTE